MMAQPMTSSTRQRANRRSRSAARRELVWTVNPGHPIASRIPQVCRSGRCGVGGIFYSKSRGARRIDGFSAFCACEGRDQKAADTGN
jgi:hypothetical protein